jgi:D-hexose-6-phosphate mutarotase
LASSGENWVELPNPHTSETDSSEVAETLALQGVDLVRIYTTNFETVVITDPEIYRDSIISTPGRPPTGIALQDVVRWEQGEALSSQMGDVVKKHWWPIIMVVGGVALPVSFYRTGLPQ